MYKKIVLLSAFALSACSGDNGTFGGVGSDEDDGASTAPSNVEIYVGDEDDMNNLVYDADNDELIINNLPFDGVDGRYVNVGTTALANFQVYASQSSGETGQLQYYAVYGEGDYGHAGAAGTDAYRQYGHGGAVIARNSANVDLPVGRGELQYTGSYAGLRVTDDEVGVGSSITLSDGDVTINVDLLDFDVTGAVSGLIDNRSQYTTDGTFIGSLEAIVLNETATISSDGIIEGTANTYAGVDTLQSGEYKAVFAGPNGEEIIGTVRITGEVDDADADAGTVQETGVFIVAD